MQFNDKAAAVVLADQIRKGGVASRKNQLLSILGRKIGGEWKGARSDARLIEAIESALNDPGLRVQGINVASSSQDGRYGPALMSFAKDEKASEEVRVAAIEALGRIKPPRTAEFLDNLILGLKGKGSSTSAAEAAVRTMPAVRDASAGLAAMIVGKDFPLGLRREALRTYARLGGGGLKVIALARDGKLPEDLKTEAMTLVHRDADRRVRSEADEVLPLPKSASGRPLPSLFELIRREGKADRGQAVFYREGANSCATCHRVQGRGQWIGPDLSTIGTKYGKSELIQSILNPSAAIGYNFRSTIASLTDGRVVTGLAVEETPARLVLKTAEGQRVAIRPSEIEDKKQSEVSLMPEGLAQSMSDQDLVDLLAFLGTLKQPVSVVGQYQASAPVAKGDDSAIVSGSQTGLSWSRLTADFESQVALKPIAGEDGGKVVYLKSPVLAPEPTDAKLVLDVKSDVTAFLNGKAVELRAESGGPKTADVRLAKGKNLLVLKVPGGSQGPLVTTFVASKPLEFR
jgi:putative heme-binding domain-containing protein